MYFATELLKSKNRHPLSSGYRLFRYLLCDCFVCFLIHAAHIGVCGSGRCGGWGLSAIRDAISGT